MDNGLDIDMRSLLALHAALYRAPRPRLPIDFSRAAAGDWADASLRRLAATGAVPDWRAADQALEWLAQPGHRVLLSSGRGYPARLRAAQGSPWLLFVDGDPASLAAPQLAIVGSRQATPRGRDIAQDFARQLAAGGVVITSGLARGIDGAAHRGALAAGGRTIAVLGAAVDRIYPAAHRELAAAVRDAGALVSEFPFGTAPLPGHFPLRNRIISGLALGTLVVEAAPRSGSLSTALHALEQGREVFAVPGSILNPLSRGCHALIKQGAKLTEEVADILDELPELRTLVHLEAQASSTHASTAPLALDDACLLGECGWDPFTVDDAVERSGLTVQEVSSMLMRLELAGIVQVQGTGSYLRIR